MYFLKRPRKSAASSQYIQKWGEDYRDLENYLTSVPRCFHSRTFQPKFAKDVSSFLWSSRNLSQIFWLGILSHAPEAWKPSLMSVTTNTGWSSRPVEGVTLQVISFSYSTLNNSFIVGNTAVYVDHRHSGNGKRVVQWGSLRLPNRTLL